ncbi:MAG: AI-2E family transporter, partial [Streptomyces sp.]|nr:AI-2E family transporter [Streptomyces sp.]
MSRVPGWLGRLGAGLTEMSERLDERRAAVERESAELQPVRQSATATATATLDSGESVPSAPSAQSADSGDSAPADPPPPPTDHVPRPPAYAPAAPPPRPDPTQAVPWGVRVAAEAGWRLLVLAGTVWVLMRVISAVQLVVLAFVIALLLTALMQPSVAWLMRRRVPRGLATALTAILGFVVIGLMGWFVTWQVMENIDNLS